MNWLTKDLSADKIKLIYEFNKSSPLFTRVAAAEIEHNNYLKAIEILEKGIELYPDYPTAHFLYGLALAYAGDLEKALFSINCGDQLLEHPATVEFYREKIETIIRERNSVSETKRTDFLGLTSPHAKVSNENGIETHYISRENNTIETELEEYLDKLAEKINKAKIKYNPDEQENNQKEIPEFTGKKFVSETLAEIYYSQGKYKEALQIYEELLNLKPRMNEYYQKKIEKLKSIIEHRNE